MNDVIAVSGSMRDWHSYDGNYRQQACEDYPGLRLSQFRDGSKGWDPTSRMGPVEVGGQIRDGSYDCHADGTDSMHTDPRLSGRDGSFEDSVRPTASTEYIVSEIGESTRVRIWYQGAYRDLRLSDRWAYRNHYSVRRKYISGKHWRMDS